MSAQAVWTYANPVRVRFGAGCFADLASQLGQRRYAIVTYPDAMFGTLVERLAALAGAPVLVIDDVLPNPDCARLSTQAARFAECAVDVIVAIGGGSVLDTAKVCAAAGGDFGRVQRHLAGEANGTDLSATPIIAVPTTAGTGSEVTCWATVWDAAAGRKYSLSRETLYPEAAIIDPVLMLEKPRHLTVATGLDALSHALESIWNVNANPVSACFAVAAARASLDCLPALVDDLSSIDLRTRAAQAALFAGLAFSNTKTALAHNLSYPMTLGFGVEHGIACSFTLPVVLMSVAGIDGFSGDSLRAIFGDDLVAGAESLKRFLEQLGVPVRLEAHGVPTSQWGDIVDAAFVGERGGNFIGEKSRFKAAARALDLV